LISGRGAEVGSNEESRGKGSGGKGSRDRGNERSFWRELPVMVLLALGLALLIRTFLIQAFYIPSFQPGDTLRVHVKVVEGNRTRVQVFQGVCLRRSGSGIRETFTVRKVSFGVGVERTFPVHTPIIEKIEVATRGDVRRAKLYYLRGLHGKAAKIKERREPTPEQ